MSARSLDLESDRLFQEGRYTEAAERFRIGAEKHGEDHPDGLLWLLDWGLALHAAGQYEMSTRVLLRADKIADIKDYTSLAAESATLLTSDNIKQYQGEDFEKVLINTYLAMNYALIGQADEALVEARRVNRKLHMMVEQGGRKYKQSAFARYLSAVLYESLGEWNDAYIDYKAVLDLEPGFRSIGLDLWRMAYAQGDREEQQKWVSQFELSAEDRARAKKALPRSGFSEIIVLYENGISPAKHPNPNFHSLPVFYPRANPVREAEVWVDGVSPVRTELLDDIEAVAIQNLNEKYGAIIAKKVAGVVVKEVVADQIGRQTGSRALGALARLAFYASDQADVRSWNLLPRDLQIARIVVQPGLHTIKLQPLGADALVEKTVQLLKGQKVFVNFRYMP